MSMLNATATILATTSTINSGLSSVSAATTTNTNMNGNSSSSSSSSSPSPNNYTIIMNGSQPFQQQQTQPINSFSNGLSEF